jgi:DNA modification methylase
MGKAFFSERVANQIWSIKRESNNVHPAVYPEALAEPLIRMWTRPQDIVFDPFSGSGTTAVSAMTWRRRFFGVERNDLYHEYSIERLNVRGRAISCSEMMGDLFDLESDLYTDREVKARQLVLNGG